MSERALTFLAMAWLFLCVPFFLMGDGILDPSGLYSDEKLVWVATVQWAVLVAPLIALWFGFRSAVSKDS